MADEKATDLEMSTVEGEFRYVELGLDLMSRMAEQYRRTLVDIFARLQEGAKLDTPMPASVQPLSRGELDALRTKKKARRPLPKDEAEFLRLLRLLTPEQRDALWAIASKYPQATA